MINHTIIQGRLVAAPELRSTRNGTPFCSFRVAWSEKRKETEVKLFLGCVAWRGVGEFVANYFSKGQEIALEGELSTRDWEDRDGNKRQSVELTVSKAHFCGPKQGMGRGSVPAYSGFAEIDDDGDLPL